MKNPIDAIVQWISPERGLNRMRARRVIGAYEAAKPTRTRKNPGDNASGDSLNEFSITQLRGQARHLEQNYDFAFSILNSLVNNVVGPRGIGVEFQPKTLTGEIHQDFARELNRRHKEWARRPEVTREMSYGKAQRLAAMTWLRDGEVLKRDIMGTAPGIANPTDIEFAFELLEPDFLPVDLNNDSKRIVQGIEKSAWGRPIAYWLYDEHPGGNKFWRIKTRRHSADNITHLKMVRRLHQSRGVSIFATVMNRINDIKDYEESERVAARIAAAMVGFIKKGNTDNYAAPSDEDDQGNRMFSIRPGMIWDDLAEGEDVGTLESNRPSGLLSEFLQSMQRMAAGGTMASFSTISRNYNGTFSAQRQETVEQWSNYETLSCEFIEKIVEPDTRRFIEMLKLTNDFEIPADVDPDSLLHLDFITPAMPWIDPQKEATANEKNVALGVDTPQRIIRRRGGNPADILDQIELWQKELDTRGIKTGQAPPVDPQPDDDQEDEDEDDENSTN